MLLSLEEPKGSSYDIYVKKLATVSDLKKELGSTLHANESRLIIIFEGKVLIDERTLESYGIQDGGKVFYVLKPEKIKQEEPKKKKPESTQEEPETYMDKIMYSPIGKAMMKSMEENPEVFSEFFNSIPALQSLTEKNPELNHALNDPEQMAEIMRINMTKGNKKQAAMSMDHMINQVEQTPIGLHFLNRAMKDLEEPLSGVFQRPEPKTVIPEEPLKAPAEAPLPGHKLGMYNSMIPITVEDQKQIAQINIGLSNIKSAIQRIESRGFAAPKKEEVYKAVLAEARRINIRGNMEVLRNRYPQQLNYLKSIGFTCEQDNLAALSDGNGDIKKAIRSLMRHIRKGKPN
jgi:hypothetical protein